MKSKFISFILLLTFLLTKSGLCIPQLTGGVLQRQNSLYLLVFGNEEVKSLELLTPIDPHTITQGEGLNSLDIPAFPVLYCPIAFRLPSTSGLTRYPGLTFCVNDLLYMEMPELNLEEIRNMFPSHRQLGLQLFTSWK